MKKVNLFLLSICSCLMFSCSGSGTKGTETTDDKSAVCIWDNVSLKETPEESGKWLCSVSVGETVTFLDETKEDNTGKKMVSYIKIRLNDNKEGWVQSDFVITKSKPAAIVEDAEIYSRPDLLNKSGKLFSKMDIVAVKSEKDGFIEVIGKRKNGKWIESGWLKSKTVTYSEVDIAVAKFAGKAMDIVDVKKREEAINEILNNPDMNGSIFISSLSKVEPKEEAVVDTSSTTPQ